MSFLLNDSFLSAFYRAVPFLPAMYSVGAYLGARRDSGRIVWIVGVLIAVVPAAFTVVATTRSGIAVPRLIGAALALYGLPMVLALATLEGSRRRPWPRWVGILVILAVCVAAEFIARYLSLAFLGVVEATA